MWQLCSNFIIFSPYFVHHSGIFAIFLGDEEMVISLSVLLRALYMNLLYLFSVLFPLPMEGFDQRLLLFLSL